MQYMVKVTRETVIKYLLGAAIATVFPLNLFKETKIRSTYLVVEGIEIPYRMSWLKKGDKFTLYNPDGTVVRPVNLDGSDPGTNVLLAVEDAYYNREERLCGVKAIPAGA